MELTLMAEILKGGAVGLVDRVTCPTVWLPVLCEDQAGMDVFL
jgi:hypothetical protein